MQIADHEKLFAIAHPKLGREHFVAVDRAIRNAVAWGELLAINLGQCEYPDLVAEVADLMLSFVYQCRWVLCVGQHAGHALFCPSALTSKTPPRAVSSVASSARKARRAVMARRRAVASSSSCADEQHLKTVYDDLVNRLCKELHITAAPTPLL